MRDYANLIKEELDLDARFKLYRQNIWQTNIRRNECKKMRAHILTLFTFISSTSFLSTDTYMLLINLNHLGKIRKQLFMDLCSLLIDRSIMNY